MLSFKQVKKVVQEVPYAPHMSDEDKELYKAKWVDGSLPYLEVKVSHPCQIVIRLKQPLLQNNHPGWGQNPLNKQANDLGCKNIKISMNGPAEFTWAEWLEFKEAMEEAIKYTLSQ